MKGMKNMYSAGSYAMKGLKDGIDKMKGSIKKGFDDLGSKLSKGFGGGKGKGGGGGGGYHAVGELIVLKVFHQSLQTLKVIVYHKV